MIPTNPITLAINGFLTQYWINKITAQVLPAYEVFITSGRRTHEDQERLKEAGLSPATDSTHLYNLARDFTLFNRSTGKEVPSETMEALYEDFFKPAWPGYSYFSPAKPGVKGPHIHANLPREITEKTKFIGYAGTSLVLFILFKQVLKKIDD